MTIVQVLSDAFAPWQSLYAESTLVSTTVTTIHIVTLLLAGGLAVGADRASLRALRQPATERSWHLRELGAVHRPVLIALAALFMSGVLLAAADIEVFAASTLFWVKMGLVALLIANGVLMRRTETRLTAGDGLDAGEQNKLWRNLGARSRSSLALWVLIAIAGTVLTNA
jgi:hypothetical protein